MRDKREFSFREHYIISFPATETQKKVPEVLFSAPLMGLWAFEIGPFDPFDYAPWAQAQDRL
jgi:hypothetical protein